MSGNPSDDVSDLPDAPQLSGQGKMFREYGVKRKVPIGGDWLDITPGDAQIDVVCIGTSPLDSSIATHTLPSSKNSLTTCFGHFRHVFGIDPGQTRVVLDHLSRTSWAVLECWLRRGTLYLPDGDGEPTNLNYQDQISVLLDAVVAADSDYLNMRGTAVPTSSDPGSYDQFFQDVKNRLHLILYENRLSLCGEHLQLIYTSDKTPVFFKSPGKLVREVIAKAGVCPLMTAGLVGMKGSDPNPCSWEPDLSWDAPDRRGWQPAFASSSQLMLPGIYKGKKRYKDTVDMLLGYMDFFPEYSRDVAMKFAETLRRGSRRKNGVILPGYVHGVLGGMGIEVNWGDPLLESVDLVIYRDPLFLDGIGMRDSLNGWFML
ncbi:hypothetical protein B0H66DRAFT_527187 [Apodospora peruviana]|uniref:Uncharacterized protein n=1 Tax=Apodospora peruviana TaxID=516989 RepID=A0AAE0MEP5_9PEZI|nr:hypothetical protein B0H66DRAFT_527187 [Apodospora peruviana]